PRAARQLIPQPAPVRLRSAVLGWVRKEAGEQMLHHNLPHSPGSSGTHANPAWTSRSTRMLPRLFLGNDFLVPAPSPGGGTFWTKLLACRNASSRARFSEAVKSASSSSSILSTSEIVGGDSRAQATDCSVPPPCA